MKKTAKSQKAKKPQSRRLHRVTLSRAFGAQFISSVLMRP